MEDSELGAWLRGQREQRGWDRAEMASRLVRAGWDNGDTAVPDALGMKRNLIRWETKGGISPRYRPHLCRVFDIDRTQFGPQPDEQPPLPPAQPAMIYRGIPEPILGGEFAAGHEVVMAAAHESNDHAAEHEQHAAIGDFTFGQLRAEVVRLSRQMDTGSPLLTFLELRRVRDRIYTLLERRLWLREQSDLYFLCGIVNGLMGATAKQLGYLDSAEELLRAGWAYASIIDHNPLRAMLRLKLASVMYYRDRYSESRDFAADGLRYVSQGSMAAELHVRQARATARLGDVDTARRSVNQAGAVWDSDYNDDLLEIGGEFSLSRATHHADAGHGLIAINGAEHDAATELEQAISLYDTGPGQGEEHWFTGKPMASINLAVVRLRSGALDGAGAALEPAMALPAEQRITEITSRLADVRRELAAPIFQGSPQARDLGERIETYAREAVTSGLHSLTG